MHNKGVGKRVCRISRPHPSTEVDSATNYNYRPILNPWLQTHPCRMAKFFFHQACGFAAYILMAEDEKMAINPVSRIASFGVHKNRYFSMPTTGFPPK